MMQVRNIIELSTETNTHYFAAGPGRYAIGVIGLEEGASVEFYWGFVDSTTVEQGTYAPIPDATLTASGGIEILNPGNAIGIYFTPAAEDTVKILLTRIA